MPCHELPTLIRLLYKKYICIASDKKRDRDNSEIFFLFLNENIRFVPTGTIMAGWGHNIGFYGKIKKTIHELSLLPLLM